MTRLPPLIEALLEVARALDELELPYLATMSKIDLFIAGDEAMNRQQLDRRRFIELLDVPGVTLPIASPRT